MRAHLPALTKLEQSSASTLGVRLVAICSRTQASLAKAAKRIEHNVAQYTNLADVLADDDVDVVDLVLPIAAMAHAIEACLAAGKHVLSEKPAAASPAVAAWLWQQYAGVQAPCPSSQSSLPATQRPVALEKCKHSNRESFNPNMCHSNVHKPPLASSQAWCVLENWSR